MTQHSDWASLARRLGLAARGDCAVGRFGAFPAGLTSRLGRTWVGLVLANPHDHAWTLTRRWEPQARPPRRPDDRTVKFRDLRLTERYVGVADYPGWFREEITPAVADALVEAADANRLGSCTIALRAHLLTAQYRDPAAAVPDLRETSHALATLAAALDEGEGAPPDATASALLSLPGQTGISVKGVRLSATRLDCALPKDRGIRGFWQRAPGVHLDWERRQLSLPDWEGSLDCVRQVVIEIEGTGAVLGIIDVAGGLAFVGRAPAPGNLHTTGDATGRLPPLVVVRSEECSAKP